MPRPPSEPWPRCRGCGTWDLDPRGDGDYTLVLDFARPRGADGDYGGADAHYLCAGCLALPPAHDWRPDEIHGFRCAACEAYSARPHGGRCGVLARRRTALRRAEAQRGGAS